MQCPRCNTENNPGATFCSHCGASLATTAPGWGGNAAPSAGASAGLSDNAASAIAYITIIPAIIFLLIEPYNKRPLVRFHAFQSIGFGVVAFVLQIIVQAVLSVFLTIASSVLGVFALGLGLTYFLQLILGLVFFVIWVVLVLKASKGEWFKLPLLGDFAENQAKNF
ncbi:MAG: zinc-ribbon domain-containing protein [Acidobacteriaceae bacterium]